MFEGEDGKDDGGLKVDAFSRFFKCLYDNEALGVGALFEESSGGLVLPRPDAQLRGWTAPPALGSSGAGGPSERCAPEAPAPKAKRQKVSGGKGYDLHYEDGDKETNVPASRIRALPGDDGDHLRLNAKVEGKFKQTRDWYPATITRVPEAAAEAAEGGEAAAGSSSGPDC